MGIPFKDIQQGQYYKGYDAPVPTGKKCFFYVEQVQHSTSGMVTYSAWTCPRKVVTRNWKRPFQPITGKMDDSSLMKELVSAADLAAERTFACPAQPSAPAAPKPPAPPQPQPSTPSSANSLKKPTSAELEAQAKAERNKGKIAIPENAHSPVCLKCGGSNKEVPLARFSVFFCENCEPS